MCTNRRTTAAPGLDRSGAGGGRGRRGSQGDAAGTAVALHRGVRACHAPPFLGHRAGGDGGAQQRRVGGGFPRRSSLARGCARPGGGTGAGHGEPSARLHARDHAQRSRAARAAGRAPGALAGHDQRAERDGGLGSNPGDRGVGSGAAGRGSRRQAAPHLARLPLRDDGSDLGRLRGARAAGAPLAAQAPLLLQSDWRGDSRGGGNRSALLARARKAGGALRRQPRARRGRRACSRGSTTPAFS